MHDRHEAADTAMHKAFNAAEVVAMLLDRHNYDNGDDAALIEGWTSQLRQLERQIRATLGEPRQRLFCGALVPSRNPTLGGKL
jgi:hypothetical protein